MTSVHRSVQPSERWSVVVPVKRFSQAKLRLTDGLAPLAREEVARAFALDTLHVLAQVPAISRILVITDFSEESFPLPERAQLLVQRSPGLNSAIREGIRGVRAEDPAAPTLIIVADLPTLRADHLDAALAAAGQVLPRVVVDASGTGTTALTIPPGGETQPSFGTDSARRHRHSGYTELRLPRGNTLRCDVDTLEDLLAAQDVGCGPNTRQALRRWELDRPNPVPATRHVSQSHRGGKSRAE